MLGELGGKPHGGQFFEGHTQRVVAEIGDVVAFADERAFDPLQGPSTEAEAVDQNDLSGRR